VYLKDREEVGSFEPSSPFKVIGVREEDIVGKRMRHWRVGTV
jgi:hypothetical protein